MAKHSSGGRQCSPGSAYEPAVEQTLAARGMPVFSHQVRSNPAWRAYCTGPAHRASHCVQILAEQEYKMGRLGFELGASTGERYRLSRESDEHRFNSWIRD